MMNVIPVAQDDTYSRSDISDLDGMRDLDDIEIDAVNGGVGMFGAAVAGTIGLVYSVGTGKSFGDTLWNVGVSAAFGFVGAGPGLTVNFARYAAGVGGGVMPTVFLK